MIVTHEAIENVENYRLLHLFFYGNHVTELRYYRIN
jgi:hypothetical protein